MTHADPAATMQRLEEWIKKHRFLTVQTGGHYDLCTGTSVSLTCIKEGKKAVSDDGELYDFGVPDRSTEFHPTVCDVIALALDRWDGLVPQYGESSEQWPLSAGFHL